MGKPVFIVLLFLLSCASCEIIFYQPPATWFVYPIAEFSSDSIPLQDLDDLVEGREDLLKSITVGVLTNPNRRAWYSKVGDEFLDERRGENVLLAEFLIDRDLFAEVVLLDDLEGADQDYIISCSLDCIYQIELDGSVYLVNLLTLGIGFLLGWPHQDSSAFYVLEGLVYENRGGELEVVTGSLAMNHKEWYCDNIYWRPSFYGPAALEALFEQFLYDFLEGSGCLAR